MHVVACALRGRVAPKGLTAGSPGDEATRCAEKLAFFVLARFISVKSSTILPSPKRAKRKELVFLPAHAPSSSLRFHGLVLLFRGFSCPCHVTRAGIAP